MAKQSKMEQMQDLLLGMLSDLSDPKTDDFEEQKIMVQKAKAMSLIGNTLINSAKAEILYMKENGSLASRNFLTTDGNPMLEK